MADAVLRLASEERPSATPTPATTPTTVPAPTTGEALGLLRQMRSSLERLVGADGLAALELYIQCCGNRLPVEVTAGGAVILPGADPHVDRSLAAFDLACAILPTFTPRELATAMVPLVHALLLWEAQMEAAGQPNQTPTAVLSSSST